MGVMQCQARAWACPRFIRICSKSSFGPPAGRELPGRQGPSRPGWAQAQRRHKVGSERPTAQRKVSRMCLRCSDETGALRDPGPSMRAV